jgi:four helix bundle protein
MQKDLEKLKIWKRAQDLAQRMHELIQPIKNNYTLKDQVDRSSQAVADNIAEMFGAYYYNNKIKSLYDARKEALETINHLIKFKRRKLLNENICDKLCLRYDEEIRAINAYIRYIVRKRDENKKVEKGKSVKV